MKDHRRRRDVIVHPFRLRTYTLCVMIADRGKHQEREYLTGGE